MAVIGVAAAVEVVVMGVVAAVMVVVMGLVAAVTRGGGGDDW